MFSLLTSQLPRTHQELAAAMTAALARTCALAKPQAVTAEGGAFPDIERLTINLDNARFQNIPSPHKPTQPPAASVSAASFAVSGNPVIYQGARASFEAAAREVKFDVAADAGGQLGLVLRDAADGSVQAHISRADLQTLMMEIAADAAGGVKIQDIALDLQSRGPRSVAATARVKAKAMMMSGTILIRGNIDIDDQLNAVLSNLDCSGDGMVGQMAAGVAKPKLKSYDGRRFPLSAFSLGNVRLRDVEVDVRDGIDIRARFGG